MSGVWVVGLHCKCDWWNSGAKQVFSQHKVGIFPVSASRRLCGHFPGKKISNIPYYYELGSTGPNMALKHYNMFHIEFSKGNFCRGDTSGLSGLNFSKP